MPFDYVNNSDNTSQIVPSPSHSAALSPISPVTNWSDEDFVLLTPNKIIKQEASDMLDINFAHNYNLSGNYNVNRIGLPNSRVNMNASQINARNVHSGTSNMPFSNSVYIDHNSWIKSEVKDELDTYGCINANLSTNTIPPFINRFIKREPDNNYGSCNSNNNEFNNSVITSTSANVSTNGVFFTQIQNLALKECAREIDVACDALGISADPFNWNVADVQKWLIWTQRQFNLQPFPLEYFGMDGMTLCSLNESDFKQRAPHCGEILYAQLDIWKTAVEFRPEDSILEFSSILNSWSSSPPPTCSSPPSQASVVPSGPLSTTGGDLNTSCLSPVSPPMFSSPIISGNTGIKSPKPGLPSSIESGIVTSDYGSEGTQSDDDISDDGCDLPTTTNVEQSNTTSSTTGGRSGSGSHIHLWQFLKELLSQPQLYGSCIRWLDRQKGIFKIEDSVRVARLWGKRKNRPAMNYDKLSRSIRQYYKKGIMKKTERSQRLVYQFCHPYCL
jgi:hypothetical protein